MEEFGKGRKVVITTEVTEEKLGKMDQSQRKIKLEMKRMIAK